MLSPPKKLRVEWKCLTQSVNSSAFSIQSDSHNTTNRRKKSKRECTNKSWGWDSSQKWKKWDKKCVAAIRIRTLTLLTNFTLADDEEGKFSNFQIMNIIISITFNKITLWVIIPSDWCDVMIRYAIEVRSVQLIDGNNNEQLTLLLISPHNATSRLLRFAFGYLQFNPRWDQLKYNFGLNVTVYLMRNLVNQRVKL